MITIRKAKVGDEKAMIEFINKQVRKKQWSYTGTNKPKNKDTIKETRENLLAKSPTTFYFLATDEEKIIGSVGITQRGNGRLSHRATIGWGIDYNYRRRGIGTKLVKTMLIFAKKRKFKRIDAEIAIENKASIKLAKHLGFKIECSLKKGMLLDNGKYIDTYVVGKIL
ncbi:MAG: GNAT family N-acetyltransferase [Nanoarchaeota archaeon]|nr:GNAT family N-acetyltransferase [Nanoarchaeota archaeon]